jgi:hypothetical protein
LGARCSRRWRGPLDPKNRGPVYAKKPLRAFGNKVFDVIETEPSGLRYVDGIGPVRANRIVVGWAGKGGPRDHGVPA